jgi:hypothetical protein
MYYIQAALFRANKCRPFPYVVYTFVQVSLLSHLYFQCNLSMSKILKVKHTRAYVFWGISQFYIQHIFSGHAFCTLCEINRVRWSCIHVDYICTIYRRSKQEGSPNRHHWSWIVVSAPLGRKQEKTISYSQGREYMIKVRGMSYIVR